MRATPLLLLLLLLPTAGLHAQDTLQVATDSAATKPDRRPHSPKRAALYSALLPGSGQIYNRKYWKAPIVWAGLGTCLYFIRENNSEYQRYKTAYIALVDGDPNTVDEFNGAFSAQSVLDVTDTYRRWRDLSYLALAAVYILNVVDAGVDANFVRFDVGRDLSLGIAPTIDLGANRSTGLCLALTLK